MHFPKTGKMPRLARLIAICMELLITMDTSSAYSGSASDRQIVEISNLTKAVDQSEPIPAHCVIKVLELYMFVLY